MLIGAICLVAFVMWKRCQHTLLIMFVVMLGMVLVLFPLCQAVLGWTALHSAAALLPMTAVMMVNGRYRTVAVARVDALEAESVSVG